jgi:CRP/FNR family transcriptional regulator
MDTNCDCVAFFKENFPFWDKLTDDERNEMCAGTSFMTYEKGAIIHGGEDICTGASAVKSGCLRAYLLSEDGKEITLYRMHASDVCILSASCAIQAITFEVFIGAEEKSGVYIINGTTLAKISETNLYVKNYALEIAVGRFSDVIWVMQQILFFSLDKRLAVFLCDECARISSDSIALTHEQIAKYIGSAREAVSRMLKYFENEHMIKLYRGGVQIIDKKKLRELTL